MWVLQQRLTESPMFCWPIALRFVKDLESKHQISNSGRGSLPRKDNKTLFFLGSFRPPLLLSLTVFLSFFFFLCGRRSLAFAFPSEQLGCTLLLSNHGSPDFVLLRRLRRLRLWVAKLLSENVPLKNVVMTTTELFVRRYEYSVHVVKFYIVVGTS